MDNDHGSAAAASISADSSSGLRELLEQIAKRHTEDASEKTRDRPTDHAQAISADALERWLVESDSPLFLLDVSGAVVFRNPAAARLMATQAPTKGSTSFGCLSHVQNKSSSSEGNTLTAKLSALADSRWIVELHNIRIAAQAPGGGVAGFLPEETNAAGAQAPPDEAIVHDLLNLAMGIQVIADLLEQDCTSREERREYAKLLSRSACQLLTEVERQRSSFDRAETDRTQARANGL